MSGHLSGFNMSYALPDKINGRPVKREGYSQQVRDAKRDKRRAQADARDCVYGNLTLAARLDAAHKRRGESKREITRLLKQAV